MGHDTFQYLQLQYTFFNEVALNGSLPQWMPFMTHGTVSNVWIMVSQGLLASALVPFAGLLEQVNYLYIFEAGLLFDELVLLLGCVLLARRCFSSLATVVFVSTAVTFTAISSLQPWYDFHLFYLLPLILYCLGRAIGEASAAHLFLAGLLGVANLLGNLPYFVPVLAFVISAFGVAIFAFEPHRTIETIKGLRYRISWRHALALLIPALLAGAVLLYLKEGASEIAFHNIGRSEAGTVSGVAEFLSYGGYTGWGKYSELIGRYTNNLDNTIYGGLLVAPFALVALACVRSRLSYSFGATAIALFLFGAASLLSVAFYYLFPLGDFFRHIGLTAPLAKLFLVFYAGFGFERFWTLLQGRVGRPWRELPRQDKLALLLPAGAMAVISILVLVELFQWYPVFDFSPWAAETKNQLYTNRSQVSAALQGLLLLSAVFLVLLVAMVKWPSQVMVLGSLLLVMHLLDVYSLKIEREYRRLPQVSQEVVNLFGTYDYDFALERSQGRDYYSNSRFAALAPAFLGSYGALYWNIESFLYLDSVASLFRTEHWLKGVDAFHRVWTEESTPRHLGMPIPESAAYRKLSGFEFPKLQVFSRVQVLPTDQDISDVLAKPGFAGDLLLTSEAGVDSSFAQVGLIQAYEAPVARQSVEEVALSSYERLNGASMSVQSFTFDTLQLVVDTGSSAPSVLYYADAWHPKWRASVNEISTPVLQANLAYKAVILPPGESLVVFKFGDWRSELLLEGIVLVGLLAVGGVLYLLVTELPLVSRLKSKSPDVLPAEPNDRSWIVPARYEALVSGVIERTKRSDMALPLLIFFAVAIPVAALRISMPYAWDDTASIAVVERTALANVDNKLHTVLSTALNVWRDSGDPGQGYRPLNSLIVVTQILFFGRDPVVPTLLQATLLGITAVLIFLLVVQITQKKLVAIGAALFFSFSVPVLTATWTLLNQQILVSTLIVLGLLSYVRYVRCGQRKWLYLLWAICLIGPFLRELTIVLVLTVLLTTIAERSRDKALLVSLPILLLHALFPSYLPNLLLFGNVEVLPIFSRGYGLSRAGEGLSLQDLHYEVPYHVLLFVPPLAIAAALMSVMLFFITHKKFATTLGIATALTIMVASFAAWYLSPVITRYQVPPGTNFQYPLNPFVIFLPALSLIVMSMAGFSFNKLLPIWFGVSVLPSFALYTVDVHLIPASLPWIVMVLLWIDRLPGMVSSARVQLLASMSGKFRSKVGLLANDAALKRAVRFLVVASLFFAVSHQAMNLIAVRQTFGAFTSATSSMAEWLRENIDTKQQAIVLTNLLQGWDIPLMTDGAVQNYAFLGPDSWPFREEVIDDRLALDNLIYSASSSGRKIFYLLETSPAEFPLEYDISPPGKLEARTTFSLNGDYPVIDPLAALLPRTYWQFPGPPDLLHYATLQSGPGYRQVGATYTLSEVVALVLYDDDESVWATENGASSSSERSLVEIGKSSLEVTWENSGAAVYYNFPMGRDWTVMKNISFYVYGADTGAQMAMRARFKRHGGPDWVEFVWEDNFTGWQQLRFDLRSPDSVSGVVDWTDVSQILFRPLADLSATLRFDNLVVGTGSQQDAITEGPVKEVEGKIDVLAPAGR